MNDFKIHVIGASGRSGIALAAKLGQRLIPIVRDNAKWRATGFDITARVANLTEPDRLSTALRDATHIVSCAHARHAAQVITAAPPAARLIFLGSTRKFTRWPDEHGLGVHAGEAAFLNSGRGGVMLHPTMIYGARGEDNVQRLANLIRRMPILPLPAGGQSLVQPIHQDDVTRAILAALAYPWTRPETLVIAGPEPMPYRAFILAIALAAGTRPPWFVNLPASVMIAAATLTHVIPGLPTIGPKEVRRLLENKAFDITPMRETLKITPIDLATGLALTFPPAHESRLIA